MKQILPSQHICIINHDYFCGLIREKISIHDISSIHIGLIAIYIYIHALTYIDQYSGLLRNSFWVNNYQKAHINRKILRIFYFSDYVFDSMYSYSNDISERHSANHNSERFSIGSYTVNEKINAPKNFVNLIEYVNVYSLIFVKVN